MGPEGNKLKILIIGASGLLGYELAQQAHQAGHELHLVTRRDEIIVHGANHIVSDLTEFDLSTLPKVDAIYYLAQSKNFRDFPGSWEDIFNINVKLPLEFMNWGQRIGVSQFHLASSGGIYQGGVKAVDESDLIHVNREMGFYFSTRLSSEIMAKNFAGFYKTFSIIRPFFIYGPRQNRSMLIPRLVDSVKDGKPVTLNGELGIRINPIHVSDAAGASLALLTTSGFGVYNVAGPETLSIRDICECASRELGKTPNYVTNPPTDDLVADNSRIREVYPFEMKRFSSVVREML